MAKFIMISILIVIFLLIADTQKLYGSNINYHDDDIYWHNGLSSTIPGVDGVVYAMVEYDGQLIIGGHFTIVGDCVANGIAAWDGSKWSSLGSGISGFQDYGTTVLAMTEYNGNLIVGGGFRYIDDIEVNCIAEWDGNSWSALGEGVNGRVNALAVYDNELIVGGDFLSVESNYKITKHIARWNGSEWNPIIVGEVNGLGGYDYPVHSLEVYNNTLIAGGGFSGRVKSWNGSSWETYYAGPSFYSSVTVALTIFRGDLIASSVTGLGDGTIAKWNGSDWISLSSGDSYGINELKVYNDQLIAAGSFNDANIGDMDANNIIKWDGSNWTALASGVTGSWYCPGVHALAVFNEELIAGGGFSIVGDVAADGLAKWDGISWSVFSGGFSNVDRFYTEINSFAIYNDQLVVSGDFWWAGNTDANRIAAWDGSNWIPFGSGINGVVNSLTVYNGKLIAGGEFDTAGEVEANKIAAWDGSNWSPLGIGIDDDVYSLIVYDGKLIAGGRFQNAGGISAKGLASWDGSNWSSFSDDLTGYIYTMTIKDNELIVAGDYIWHNSNQIPAGVAIWDGANWLFTDETSDTRRVRALTIFGDKIVVGCYYYDDDYDKNFYRINAWDESGWSMLGYTDYYIYDIIVFDNNLYAGGEFKKMKSDSIYYIATWDGDNWSSLGSGIEDNANEYDRYYVKKFIVFNDTLIIGGNFTIAGGKVSPYISQWAGKVSTDIKSPEFEEKIPGYYCLRQNYPNPFNPITNIDFGLPTKSHVKLEVFNLLGQKVSILQNSVLEAGNYNITWDGQDAASGIYFYRLEAGDFIETRKMLLLK